MKHNIIIHKDLCIELAEGTLFTQHSIGTKTLIAKLEGWTLEDGACLFIAFKKGADEISPVLMAFEPKEGVYYLDIPNRVMCNSGNWKICVYKKLNWNEGTDTASAVEVGRAKPLYITATVCDEKGHCVTEYDVASAVNTILKCSEIAEGLNGQAGEARDGAVAAKECAEIAQQAADDAKTTAVNSAETATAQAEIAGTRATAAADSATEAGAASVTARQAATKAEEHETSTREMLARAIKQASDAAVSAQTADEKARQAAELFAMHSIKISTEFATVGELPVPGNSQTIYFIPNGGTGENGFDEYVWVESKAAYEKIGSTEVNLSEYVTKNGSEMTGTLTTPKICVDKIACNGAESILVEPKVEFGAHVAFNRAAEFKEPVKLMANIDGTGNVDINGVDNISAKHIYENGEKVYSPGNPIKPITFVGNGQTVATYNGVEAKTINITGAPGPKGDKGDIGPQGPKGDTGPQEWKRGTFNFTGNITAGTTYYDSDANIPGDALGILYSSRRGAIVGFFYSWYDSDGCVCVEITWIWTGNIDSYPMAFYFYAN